MQKRIKIGVIPAAGAGARLGYLSNLLPKTLFPIYDRPILHHVIDLMESLGIEDIYIIVNYHKEKIKEYYKNIRTGLNAKLHFIEQKKLDGLANADECIIADSLEPMIELFYGTGSIATEAVIKESNMDILRQTCSANINKEGRILEIIEKPENPPYMTRGCGIYLFKPEIFNFIRSTSPHPVRKEKDITSVINNVASTGQSYGYFLKGHNININDYEELLRANLLFKKHCGKKDK